MQIRNYVTMWLAIWGRFTGELQAEFVSFSFQYFSAYWGKPEERDCTSAALGSETS